MSYESIILEKSGDIGKLIFSRPKVLNAYNKTLSDEIGKGFNELAADDSVKVIVLTGEGKAFMAGADINMVTGWSELDDVTKVNAALDEMLNPNLFEDCPKPVIAAINGLAFGMGCEIAMACDFRIASEKAKFGQPEIKIGIIPGAGGIQRLMNLVGATKALEMITIGDPIDAQEAYRIGLINKITPQDKLMEEVEAFAAKLAERPPIGIEICKKVTYKGGNMPIREGLEYERKKFCEILLSEDATEGTKAFLEKRKAEFKGK